MIGLLSSWLEFLMAHVEVSRNGKGTLVRIVWSRKQGKKQTTALGTVHTAQEVEVLKTVARTLIEQAEGVLPIPGYSSSPSGTGGPIGPLVIEGKRRPALIEAVEHLWDEIGFDALPGPAWVLRAVVTARLYQPSSKAAVPGICRQIGIRAPSRSTIDRALPGWGTPEFAATLSRILAAYAKIGPESFILYDVTTLRTEAEKADDFRIPGFSKERSIDPQITVGLLAKHNGFPLALNAYPGNTAETKTMIPHIRAFLDAWGIPAATVIADAGMFNTENIGAIRAAGLDYILCMKVGIKTHPVLAWRQNNPDAQLVDGQFWSFDDTRVTTQDKPFARDIYHYSKARADLALYGLEQDLNKARSIVEGKRSIKKNRLIKAQYKNKTIDWAKVEDLANLAGIKAYRTSRTDLTPAEVVGYYRQQANIEAAFRIAKTDLKARPFYHRVPQNIRGHLAMITINLAIAHVIQTRTGLSTNKAIKQLATWETGTTSIAGQTIPTTNPEETKAKNLLAKITQIDP